MLTRELGDGITIEYSTVDALGLEEDLGALHNVWKMSVRQGVSAHTEILSTTFLVTAFCRRS